MYLFRWIWLILPLSVFAQGIFFDFENNLNGWQLSSTSDSPDFVIENGKLQASGPAETSSLYAYYPLVTAPEWRISWTFEMQYPFNPSGSNQIRFVALADAPEQPIVTLEIGESGSPDALKVFHQEELVFESEKIIETLDHVFRLEKDGINWTLLIFNESWIELGSFVIDHELQGRFLGVEYDHTASRNTAFSMDNLEVNFEVPPDTTGPKLLSAEWYALNEALLIFNEPITTIGSASVNDHPAQYTLSGDSVFLSFDPFENGDSVKLELTRVSDSMDNVSDILWQDRIILTSSAFFRDIVINEIMFDPSPPNGLPEEEYMELLNVSSKFIDLGGYTISDVTDSRSLPDTILPPGAYLILQGSFLPSLNNSGDEMRLISNENKIIDSVYYNSSWHDAETDGGISLELVNPYSRCLNAANWKSSTAPSGGSPGAINSVFNDQPQSVYINRVKAYADTVHIAFSSPVLTDSIIIDFGRPGTLQAETPWTKTLSFLPETHFSEGQEYTVDIGATPGCSGYLEKQSVSFYLFHPGVWGDLLITEIMADPEPSYGLPATEYIEIFNAASYPLDLDGWEIKGHTIIGPAIISPGEYRLIASGSGYPDAIIPDEWSENELRTQDEISILNTQGQLIDYATYSLSLLVDDIFMEGGFSLERKSMHIQCLEENWGPSTSLQGGTPGKQNTISEFTTDETRPSLLGYLQVTDTVFWLYFDEPVFIPEQSLILNEYRRISDRFFHAAAIDQGMLITNAEDCNQNILKDEKPLLNSRFPEKGDLLISEILFDARHPEADFIELFNFSDDILNLSQTKLLFRNEEITDIHIISEGAFGLLPGSAIVITPDIFFMNRYHPFHSPAVAGLPRLPLEADTIFLLNQQSLIMDSVYYSDKWHSSVIDNTKGVSLERVAANTDGIRPPAWRSGPASAGFSSPGRFSMTANAANTSAGGSIRVEPEIINAFQPTSTITIQLEQSDMKGILEIYDKGGQLVRRLASNYLFGNENTFSWNGRDEHGKPCAPGNYIAFFRGYTTEGEKMMLKQRVAVGW